MSDFYTINTYQKKSYIILEGEKRNTNFYIIRKGKVNITKKYPVIGEKGSEVLGPGDFFGVIGAMSQLPHLESAYAATDVETIVINAKRFGDVSQNNPALAIKIIRFFSKKLRQFSQREIKEVEFYTEEDNFKKLFNVGETYFTLGKKRSAAYVYRCYLYYYPNGNLANSAKKRLEELDYSPNFTKKQGMTQEFNDGEIIFCECEPSNEVYILKFGKVRITKIVDKKEVQLYIMTPGDIFGEMSFLDNKTRSATATAIQDSEIMVLKKENFELMTKKEPQIMTRLISLLSERIWNANKLILNSYFPDIDTKILDMLLILYEKSRSPISAGKNFNFNISFFDVIQMVGVDEKIDKLETTFLATHKFIKIENNSVICTNISTLEHFISARRLRIDTKD